MLGTFEMAEMPRFDAFDDEFGRDPLAIQREQQRKTRVRFWTFVGVALGAGVVGALAFAWPTAGGRLRLDLQSAVVTPISPQTHEGSDEEIGSLRHQVEALKNRITELEDAKEQAAHTVARLESSCVGPRNRGPTGVGRRRAASPTAARPSCIAGVEQANTAPPSRIT
jgi:hypothetical protein